MPQDDEHGNALTKALLFNSHSPGYVDDLEPGDIAVPNAGKSVTDAGHEGENYMTRKLFLQSYGLYDIREDDPDDFPS